jgi:predicted RNA-binding protein associated with RNAse of E/G family
MLARLRERAIRDFTFEFIRPPHRRVSMDSLLLEATPDTLVLAHELSPSKPMTVLDEVVLDRGYLGIWFLFKNQPYDIGRFYRPDGTWTGYYVDVLEPVRWNGADPSTLEPIVDLFLDLWIAPDGRHEILDEDEFEEAARGGRMTPRQIAHARRVLDDLVEATRGRAFPPPAVRSFQP